MWQENTITLFMPELFFYELSVFAGKYLKLTFRSPKCIESYWNLLW